MKTTGMLTALIMLLLPWTAAEVAAQEALRMPEVLVEGGHRGTLNQLLCKSGRQLPQPWVVFADRDAEDLRMGDKFFVVEEKETGLHLFRASAAIGRKLVNPRDMGWHNKSEMLVFFRPEVTGPAAIPKRCIIVNHGKTIDRIRKCEISEKGIPLYRSPWAVKASDTLPLYLHFYVWKSENDRYLLGAGSRFDPAAPFDGQVIGWVDRDRVFCPGTRISLAPACEEPPFSSLPVKIPAAKVFSSRRDLDGYLAGDTLKVPIWTAPAQVTGSQRSCRPPAKVRFPLLGMADPSDSQLMVGAVGRLEYDSRMRRQLCETLRKNRSQVDIFFILDHTVERNRLAYVIGQIQQEYTGLAKRFGVRFFPAASPRSGMQVIGDTGATGYRRARDFILDHQDTASAMPVAGDILASLGDLLDSAPFDTRHTNILVLVNNHDVRPPDSALQRRIRDRLVENNCYLLVFDYRNDNILLEQAGELSVAAARQYASGLGLTNPDYRFRRTAIGYELGHAGVLSILEQSDTAQLAALQMQTFLQNGYGRIIDNMQNTLGLVCSEDDDPVIRHNIHEDPFTTPLKEIRGMEGKIRYIRALEPGYTSMYLPVPGQAGVGPAWRAEVLLDRPDLEYLAVAMEKALADSAGRHFPSSIGHLWEQIFHRFSGEPIPEEELLQLTPRNITSRILGVSYEFVAAAPLRRYPLERLLACDPELARWLPGYRDRLAASLAGIRRYLDDDRLPFGFAKGEPGFRRAEQMAPVYWIPVELLP